MSTRAMMIGSRSITIGSQKAENQPRCGDEILERNEFRRIDKRYLSQRLTVDTQHVEDQVVMETVGDNDKRDVRRPMNAFLIFCKRHRSIVREKNPDLDNRSVTRILGDLWANLKDEEKVVYTDLAKQYKDAFMKANPDYKWHNPEKAVTCPKSGASLSKLTNAKVLKNEINLLPEGSIMPGKLADPCNMGGLSLLLMAGEQQSRIDQNDITGIYRPMFSSQQNINTGTTDVTKSDNSANDQHAGAVKTEDINKVVSDSAGGIKSIAPYLDSNEKTPSTNKDKPVVVEKLQSIKELENPFSRQTTTLPFTKLIDSAQTKPLLYQAVAAPKLPAKSLLADAFKDSIEKDGHSDILKDNSASTKMANFENQGHVLENLSRGDIETKLVCKVDEKENITQKVVTDVKLEEDSIKDEESPMVTCGKLVVNHIIDRLFSSDLATAGRKAVNANKDESDSGKDIKDNKDKDEKTDQDTDGRSFKNQVQLNQIEDTKREVEVDQRELNEMTVIKSEVPRETDMDKDKSDNGLNEGNDSGSVQNNKSGKLKSSMTANRGEDSTESEDVDDYQPVRKSRRRNRGQRYQELINEGIIQLSKERIAALQHPSKKEESPDEDVQPIEAYNSYVLPETAIRRIRKRTTSESAKDKIFHTDDVKRYKTGDFDLEAQIAILPVCSVENMGRKRGFARQRHNSECIHTQRKLSDIDHLSSPQPVFDVKKIVSLPPHIKVLPDTSQEPVVGSRKRKARKHSITHMVPAPVTLIKNGKVKSEVNGLGPSLIKPSEPLSDKNETKENFGDVAMETNEFVHSNCAETCKIASSECETVTNENTELNTCDKTVEVPLSDRAQTGCDQCCVSDLHSSPNIETQSGNSSGAQIETMNTVCQSEQLQALDLDKTDSTMKPDTVISDKNEVLYPNTKCNSDEVNSDQIDAINDGYKGTVKTETDVNSNNTINCE